MINEESSDRRKFRAVQFAQAELKRLLSMGPDVRDGWSERTKRNVYGGWYSLFRDVFDPLFRLDEDAGSAVRSYAGELRVVIVEYRDQRKARERISPLEADRMLTLRLAQQTANEVATKSAPLPRLAISAEPSVSVSYSRCDIGIRHLWRRKVLDVGIATPVWGGRQCFTAHAEARSSAFLAEEGVRVWEAKVVALCKAAESADGYIFVAAGKGAPFCIFNPDFKRGVTQIRKLVREAVLAELEV